MTNFGAHPKLILRELTAQTRVLDSLACSVLSVKADPRRWL